MYIGRCDGCSLGDPGIFGNLLTVDNCVSTPDCETIKPPGTPDNCTRCDVTIQNQNTKYICKYVSSISDCVDTLSVCKDPDRCKGLTTGECDAVNAFCSRPIPDGESHQVVGMGRITSGEIMWNLQLQASRCGTSRTRVFDTEGNIYPPGQSPDCLPFNDNFMSNQLPQTCSSGRTPLANRAVADPFRGQCCVSKVNCTPSGNCEDLRLQGIVFCEEDSSLDKCTNPCLTQFNGVPKIQWDYDMCYYMCPSWEWQKYWFDEVGGTPQNICSEEYYNLCTMYGCSIDSKCIDQWTQDNASLEDKAFPNKYPHVIRKMV